MKVSDLVVGDKYQIQYRAAGASKRTPKKHWSSPPHPDPLLNGIGILRKINAGTQTKPHLFEIPGADPKDGLVEVTSRGIQSHMGVGTPVMAESFATEFESVYTELDDDADEFYERLEGVLAGLGIDITVTESKSGIFIPYADAQKLQLILVRILMGTLETPVVEPLKTKARAGRRKR